MINRRILYRPMGLKELELVLELGLTGFPPRLPEQPTFYPVTSLGYARKIAKDWNSADEKSGFCGFVARFEVDSGYLARYEEKAAAGETYREFWIPAEDLGEFNSKIVGRITVIEEYYGNNYSGKTGWVKTIRESQTQSSPAK